MLRVLDRELVFNSVSVCVLWFSSYGAQRENWFSKQDCNWELGE